MNTNRTPNQEALKMNATANPHYSSPSGNPSSYIPMGISLTLSAADHAKVLAQVQAEAQARLSAIPVGAHNWHGGAPYCSCGQDTCSCQGCGRLTCGTLAVWNKEPGLYHGNIGPCCYFKLGLGHQGT